MRSMKYVLVAGLASTFCFAAATADAWPVRVAGAPKAAKAEPGPPEISKKIKLSPDGLKFGIMIEELSKLYEKVLDKEYSELYQSVEPGPRMQELDAELADKKQLIKRNRLDFGSIPSGLDNTPLVSEYSYNNGESVTQLKLRSGIHRYFFFTGNHLWKVYDIHALGKKSRLGEDYDAVVAKLTKQFGRAPRVRKADAASGRYLDQVDWADKDTVVRVIDHGNGKIGLVYADRKTDTNIDKLRPNKGPKGDHVDSEVSDVTRPVPSDAPTPKKK